MSVINQESLSAVVALGTPAPIPQDPNHKHWVGTGFLVGYRRPGVNEVFLITNKHVVQNQTSLCIRFNAQNGAAAKDFPLNIRKPSGDFDFSLHPHNEVDIVAVSLNTQFLADNRSQYSFFDLNTCAITLSKMKELGLAEGNFIYSLGFPMNLVAKTRQYPICRLGCISRISDIYEQDNAIDFLVDSQTFPGNSGGPVVTLEAGEGLNGMAKLIGVLHAYIPYKESLYSRQTGRERSVMEENSGLTLVQPVDRIIEVVEIEHRRIELFRSNPHNKTDRA